MKHDFELWFEVRGAEIYAALVPAYSTHGAAKELARAAWEEIATLSEPPAVSDGSARVEDGFPPLRLTELGSENAAEGEGSAPAPAGVGESARVLCGGCQNCALENMTESETAVVECAGCKFRGPLVGIFSRPAPK